MSPCFPAFISHFVDEQVENLCAEYKQPYFTPAVDEEHCIIVPRSYTAQHVCRTCDATVRGECYDPTY